MIHFDCPVVLVISPRNVNSVLILNCLQHYLESKIGSSDITGFKGFSNIIKSYVDEFRSVTVQFPLNPTKSKVMEQYLCGLLSKGDKGLLVHVGTQEKHDLVIN